MAPPRRFASTHGTPAGKTPSVTTGWSHLEHCTHIHACFGILYTSRRRAPVRERIDRATVNEKTMRARIKKRSLLESSRGGDPRESFSKGQKKRKEKKERETENGITELKEFKDPFVRGRALVPSVLRANHGFNHRHSVFLFFPLPPLDFHPAFLSPCLASLSAATECRKHHDHKCARDEDHRA